MNLEQLMQLEGITNYNIWWYGAEISESYIGDIGTINKAIEVKRGVDLNRIYIVMSGINRFNCIYRGAVKLKSLVEGTDCKYICEKVPLTIDEYAGRMVFYRKAGFSFYNSQASSKDFIVSEIYGKNPERTVAQFEDYDSVELSFNDLQEILDNNYSDYRKAFSTVKAVYMILDGNTGKMYIGSAYGQDGLWGRWMTYAETYHGNNEELKYLYDQKSKEYLLKFKYTILHIFPMKTPDRDIIMMESKYKERYMTREFGLNMN